MHHVYLNIQLDTHPIHILSPNSMHPHPLIYASNVCIMFRCAPGRLQPNGSRALHLLHSLFTAQDEDMQGVIASRQLSSLKKKIYPRADEVSLRLLEKGSNKTTTMKLSEALGRLGPCTYLTKVGVQARGDDSTGVYRIEQFPDPEVVQQPKKKKAPSKGYYKRYGRGKEVHLTTACAPGNLRHRLILCYKFLLEGSRMEVHLREPQGNKADSVDWALAHSLHLRPDTILAAMPRDTTMLALPATTDFSHRAKMPASAKRGTSEVMWAMENKVALVRARVSTPSKVKVLGLWEHNRGEDPRRRIVKKRSLKDTSSDPRRRLAKKPMKDDRKDKNLADLLPPKTPESSAAPLST